MEILNVVVCAMILVESAGCSKRASSQHTIERAYDFVKANESALIEYSNEVLAGRIARVDPFVYFPPPAVQTNIFVLRAVTIDENKNVYFVFSDSFTTFDVGVIYQSDGRSFLGDQMEPNIVTNVQLFGKWYYYKSH